MRKIISFSTLPDRISKIKPVIDCLEKQTLKADEIILWLSDSYDRIGKKIDKIPDFILNNDNITIKYRKDIGPITKVYYSLLEEKNPNTIIVSIDDDVYYPPTWFEKLINFSEQFPDYAIGYRGRKFLSNVKKYTNTKLYHSVSIVNDMTEVDILTGTWGVLYKKKFFKDDFYDQSKAPKKVFFVDDIWINGHLAKNNIKRYVIKSDDIRPLLDIANTTSLYENNRYNNNNDVMLNYFKKYF